MPTTQTANLGWASLVLALVTPPLALWQEALAVVSGVALVIVLILWARANGWRLRSPMYRSRPKVLTPSEERTLAETRRIKDELTELLHARARPAVDKMKTIYQSVIDELKGRPEPASTLGFVAGLYPVQELRGSEKEVRRALEGLFWDDPKGAKVRHLAREIDLEKQTSDELAMRFFFYFNDYTILCRWAKHFVRLLGGDPSKDARFKGWEGLHDQYLARLRDVLALPGIGSIRDDFEEAIRKMDEA